MSWVSLFSALAFLLIAIHVTSLPSSPSAGHSVALHDGRILSGDVSIAATAADVVASCAHEDQACQALLSANFVAGMNYLNPQPPVIPPQRPLTTLMRREGDPEALALLFATLLDHQRIPAYLVFSRPNVYVLTCGMPPDAVEMAARRHLHQSWIRTGSLEAESSTQSEVLKDPLAFRMEDHPCVLIDPSRRDGRLVAPAALPAVRHAMSLGGRRVAISYVPRTEGRETTRRPPPMPVPSEEPAATSNVK